MFGFRASTGADMAWRTFPEYERESLQMTYFPMHSGRMLAWISRDVDRAYQLLNTAGITTQNIQCRKRLGLGCSENLESARKSGPTPVHRSFAKDLGCKHRKIIPK